MREEGRVEKSSLQILGIVVEPADHGVREEAHHKTSHTDEARCCLLSSPPSFG